MLERKYDPTLPYRYVRYGRMSDPRQNRRSPDQQFDTIEATLVRSGYPWHCVATYRDDGISGRYLRKRPGLQSLLRDVEARLVRIDLITVDTLERLGRADEIAELRRRLHVEFGVLVVAADTGFSDPTGIVGKAVGLVEQIRSTENTRISRHNVIRGKKDAARRGRWPGGPPPFGFRLRRVVDDATEPADVYSVLEVEPGQAFALKLAFERAAATGDGDLRLSRWWNETPEIAADLKPVSPYTMGYRLTNPIAIGTLRWGAHRTAVVNDTRVIEASPEEAETIIEFCPALVDRGVFDRVQKIRQLRSDAAKRSRNSGSDPEKRIGQQGRGLTLKYVLSGLVRCGACRSSMRPLVSGRRSASGRKYVYYICPRRQDGACDNGQHVPEDRLRRAVLSCIRERLFPKNALRRGQWLEQLRSQIASEQHRILENGSDKSALRRDELRKLDKQLEGWSQSLANPQLPESVRRGLETRFEAAQQRQQEISSRLANESSFADTRDPLIEENELIRLVDEIDVVLAEYNPTAVHVELAKHIAAITIEPGGRIELLGKKLGVFGESSRVLRAGVDPSPNEALARPQFAGVTPRRRGRLLGSVPLATSDAHRGENAATLPEEPEFSETRIGDSESSPEDDSLMVSWRSWSDRHAAEVADLRKNGWTHARLAQRFSVSVPTIRKALRIAATSDSACASLPNKMPRARWPERHFREVAELRSQGRSLRELVEHFGRSEPLIREALRIARIREGSDKPSTEAGDR